LPVLRRRDGPSLLALTRQALPLLRREPSENLSAHGEALYVHFGITAERVAQAARALL
jgi:transketolase